MTLFERVKNVEQMIHQAEIASLRPPGSVKLLAVSKGQTSQAIMLAYKAGLDNFGENYLQEGLVKIHALQNLPLCWHFIGAIQSNKTATIAQHFSWVHGVCRKKIAQRLHDERPSILPALNVCIQVNIDDSTTKSGIHPDMLAELAADIILLPRLKLRGLMVIPKASSDEQQQYLTYLRVTELLHSLNTQLNLTLDTLSMGMSDDLSAAIRAGSTLVRVGRGIFGERRRYEHY